MAQGVAGDLGMDVEMTEGCPKGNIPPTKRNILSILRKKRKAIKFNSEIPMKRNKIQTRDTAGNPHYVCRGSESDRSKRNKTVETERESETPCAKQLRLAPESVSKHL